MNKKLKVSLLNVFLILLLLVFPGCKEKIVEDSGLSLPIYTLEKGNATTSSEYLGSVEGVVNVEIRPQVEGILEEIYVDEGDFVEKSQPLFQINSLPYVEDLRIAQANVELERARLRKADTEVQRLKPLIENEVISDVRMQTAQADYEVARSSLERAQAEAANREISLSFTEIKAPVSGYIGRIPKRIGNLVDKGDPEPLTILSDIHQVYVYFSMSESDYLFYERMRKDTISKKLNPNVRLVLADGSTYKRSGVIDASVGQINRSTGTITLRAIFDNPDALLRFGNAGKIIMEQLYSDVILIPQEATVSIQDKRFVFVLREDNTSERREINVEAVSGQSYIVTEDKLSSNDRIVLSGLDKLTNGTKVDPLEKGRVLAN